MSTTLICRFLAWICQGERRILKNHADAWFPMKIGKKAELVMRKTKTKDPTTDQPCWNGHAH